MNWLVGLVLVLKRTSLILIGRTLRSLAVVVSDCVRRVAGSVHSALPVRKPAADVGGEVTLKVALTLAPGATGSANVTDVLVAPETTASQAAARRGTRGDLEGRAHARARRDWVSERHRRLGGAGDHGEPPRGHGNTQLDAPRGRPRGIRKRFDDVVHRALVERRDARQAHLLHVVPGSHDVRLHGIG